MVFIKGILALLALAGMVAGIFLGLYLVGYLFGTVVVLIYMGIKKLIMKKLGPVFAKSKIIAFFKSI